VVPASSGHYIDRDGSVVQYVAPERVAHHVRGMNAHTLGIELVNTGRYPDWFDSRHQAMDEAYTEAQLQALERLLLALVARYRCSGLPGMTSWIGSRVPASDDPTLMVARASVIRGRCSRGRGAGEGATAAGWVSGGLRPAPAEATATSTSRAGIPGDGGVGPVAGTP
jgi:hypothetical protein